MKDSSISLGDGRRISYLDIGGAGRPCILFFHGAPSSRLRLTYLEERFLDARLRVVALDRPGYGGSSPQPGRSMLDWPADVAVVAETLGIERFIVAGHSSGGPYALVCAALLADRAMAAITLGGVTDMGWPGAWDGYLEAETELMRVADEDAATSWCAQRFGADGSGFKSASGLQLPDADMPLYEHEAIASQLAVARAEAFRQGVAGYAQDIYIQGKAWPFDPGSIRVPVHIAHGDGDTLLLLAHAQHTATLIGSATVHLLRGHGHFTILAALTELAAGLRPE